MSNDPAQQPGDEAHLEPLPDLPPDVPFAQASAAKETRPSAGPSPANLAARALEKPPQLLKQAARVLVAGSLLPWIGADLGTKGSFGNFALKLALLGACLLIMKGVDAHYEGSAAVGFGKKPLLAGRKGMFGALNMLHVLGTLGIVAVLILQWIVFQNLLLLGESVTLLLGGLTFAHIHSYLKGGKFNPLFPLMFAGCAFGGVFGLIGRVSAGQWAAAAGCAIVTAAGVLAVYTIAMAMVQAKKDGDLKKLAALEARKQARGTAKASAANRGPTP